MNVVYSTYDAKARFSEVMRLVREGRTVTITYRGAPVAEVRPIERPDTVEEHFAELEKRGLLVPSREPRIPLRPGPRTAGALARFLEERGV